REGDDLVEALADRASRQPLDRAVQEDVLAPGEVVVETRPELEQGSDPTACGDASRRRFDDAGHDAEERRLPRAVATDQTHGLTGPDPDGHVPQRPDVLRLRTAALHEEILQGARLAGVDPEAARHALDDDGTGARVHPMSFPIQTVNSS